MKIDRKIILWGADDYNILGALRQLVPYGCDVLCLFSFPMYECAEHSRYCKNYVAFDTHTEALDYLLTHFQEEKERPILSAHSDVVAELIDLHKDELSKYFVISGTTEQGLLTKIQDKYEMSELAVGCGFNVPHTMPLLPDSDVSAVSLPCFVRSAINTKRTSWHKRVKCNTLQELKEVQSELTNEDHVIVSDFIAKEYEILVIGVRFHNGNVYIPGCYMKDRWHYGNYGSGSHGQIMPDIPKCINLDSIRKMLSEIDYYGQFSVEYGIVGEKAYFYEINLRNDGTSDYFNQCGANTNLAWVYDCCDLDVSTLYVPVQKTAYMIHEIGDVKNIREMNIPIKEWFRQILEAEVYVYWNKHDIKPFFVMLHKVHHIERWPYRLCRKIWRKMFKITT